MYKRLLSVLLVILISVSLLPTQLAHASSEPDYSCTIGEYAFTLKAEGANFADVGWTVTEYISGKNTGYLISSPDAAPFSAEYLVSNVVSITANGQPITLNNVATTASAGNGTSIEIVTSSYGFAVLLQIDGKLYLRMNRNDRAGADVAVVVTFPNVSTPETGIATVTTSDNERGGVSDPIKDANGDYVFTATPNTGYMVDYWAYRTAKDGDGDYTGDYTKVSDSDYKTSLTVTLTQDTEYICYFKSSEDVVLLLDDRMSVRRALDGLYYVNFPNQNYSAAGANGDGYNTTHTPYKVGFAVAALCKDYLDGSLYFPNEFGWGGSNYQITGLLPGSDSGIDAYDNVILGFAPTTFAVITNPVTVAVYVGEGVNDESKLLYSEVLPKLSILSIATGYGYIAVPVDAMPKTDKVTVKLTVEGRQPVVKTYSIGETVITDTGLQTERAAAVDALKTQWAGYRATEFSAAHTRYSQEFLMCREEYADGLEAIKDAGSAEAIETAKTAALQKMADAVDSVFHSGVRVGVSEVVVTLPEEASILTAMCAAFERTHPGTWGIRMYGGWVNGLSATGYSGGIVEEDQQRGGWTYPLADNSGIAYFGNGVQNQMVWDGVIMPLEYGGMPGSLVWDLWRLIGRYSPDELAQSETYQNGLANKYAMIRTPRKANPAYAFDYTWSNYTLDPEKDGDKPRIEAWDALRLEYLDFLLDRETDATRAVVRKIAALGENPTDEAITAAREAYEALSDAEKTGQPGAWQGGVFNRGDLLQYLTETEQAAAAIELLIGNIGEVAYTSDSLEKIVAAESALSGAEDAVKTLVKDAAKTTLTNARSAFDALATAAVTAATDAINAISGEITLDTESAIVAARTAYDALLQAQRDAFTSTLTTKLTNAESALAALKNASNLADWEQILNSALVKIEADVTNPIFASTKGEWAVLALARGGAIDGDSAFAQAYMQNLNLAIAAGSLGAATDWERVTLALTALGIDASAYGASKVNLTQFSTKSYYSERTLTKIFGLIATRSKPYGDGTPYLADVLADQNADGGWANSKGETSGADQTAMAIQALAPFYGQGNVKTAVDNGIAWLKTQQQNDGGFGNCEATAQVVIALATLGIDANADNSGFKKPGGSPLTALLSYHIGDGAFKHSATGDASDMALEQAAYALVAYSRLQNDAAGLYDMSDLDWSEEPALPDTVDKAELQSAVTNAESLAEEYYTAESWQAFAAALSDAHGVLDDDDATQEDVDAALSTLQTAITNLVNAAQPDTVNKADLQAAVTNAANLTEINYTAESWGAFAVAFSDAQSVLDDDDATQEDVDAAKSALNAAIAALIPAVSGGSELETAVNELNAQISVANALNAADYTEETWETLSAAMTAANEALEGADGYDDADDDGKLQIISALTETKIAVANAVAALVARPLPPVAVDKAALNALISTCDALTQGNYTNASWNAFQGALTAAKEVKNNAEATQTQVDDAVTALTSAKDALAAETPKTLNSIAVSPDTVDVPVGGTFSKSSITVTAHYSDGSSEIVTDYTLGDASANSVGSKTVTVTYQSKTATFTLNVVEANKSDLLYYIERAEDLYPDRELYTTASWSSLQTALSNARTHYNNANAKQSVVDAARNTLRNAINNLMLLDTSKKITVHFTLLGTTKHGQTGNPVGLAMGGLETWISRSITIDGVDSATVYEVFMKALTEAGLTQDGADQNYVKSITRNGVTLGEFGNGPNSGWMYTVNGTHPNRGLKEWTVYDGNVIVWHYTDDYTLEDGSEAWNPPPTNTNSPSGGGNTGGGGTTIPDEETPLADAPENSATGEVKATVKDGAAVAEVKPDDVKDLIVEAKTDHKTNVTVEVTNAGSADKIELDLVVATVNDLTKNGMSLTVQSGKATVTLDVNALKTLAANHDDGETVRVVVEDVTVKPTALNDKQKAKVGNNPVIDLSVWVGNTQIHDFKGTVTVKLPELPKNVAATDYDLLTVYYLNGDGNLQEMRGARYDAASKSIVFTTDHFSKFVVAEWQNPFSDVQKGVWYYRNMRYVYSNGLMTGTNADAFSPESNLTRAMLVTVLAREAGADTNGGATWYEKAMAWGKAQSVTDGSNPNGNITREQFVTMLWRYAGSPSASGNLSAYSDAAQVSGWAKDAMAWAVGKGIITGRTVSTLAPNDTATRAEAAAMLQRFLGK
jgi:hypothetical protein